MASNAPKPKLKPLSFMEVLSPIVSLYRPATTPTSSNSSVAAPKLIILASWTGAQDLHIAKYLIKYQAIYSASQILLIKSPSSLLFRPTLIPAAVTPAVDAIKALFPSNGQYGNNNTKSTPVMLIHLFSNGGSSSISGLYDTYAASSPNRPTLPPHVTIIDSAPSTITFSSSVAFFSVGLPPVQRLFAMPFISLFALALTCSVSLGVVPDWLHVWGDAHNDRKRNKDEIRRVYVYSEEDALVDFRTVEKHATQAEEMGFVMKREKFSGTPHVAHARGKHGERYWAVVRQAWEGA